VTSVVMRTKSGPNILVRAIWYLFVGWWLTGIVAVIAWLALITIIGIPVGFYLINRLPTFLTLPPRTREWIQAVEGEMTVVTERGRPQINPILRGIWFLLVGWWLSAIWMLGAWLVSLTVIGIPIAVLMYNRTPFIASLYRY
jgi:uncharacterized membrane protein YccF (DUF307 family)